MRKVLAWAEDRKELRRKERGRRGEGKGGSGRGGTEKKEVNYMDWVGKEAELRPKCPPCWDCCSQTRFQVWAPTSSVTSVSPWRAPMWSGCQPLTTILLCVWLRRPGYEGWWQEVQVVKASDPGEAPRLARWQWPCTRGSFSRRSASLPKLPLCSSLRKPHDPLPRQRLPCA